MWFTVSCEKRIESVLGLPQFSGQQLLANQSLYVSALGFLNHRQRKIEAGTQAGGRVRPAVLARPVIFPAE